MRTIGSYEAKTYLPKLLDEVANGAEITIAKHGVPVARLVPVSDSSRKSVAETIEAIRAFRKGKKLGDDMSIKGLVDEGRRF